MRDTINRLRQEGTDRLKAMVPVTARHRLNRARLRGRQLSASQRTLPDFMLIGGQRCGTNSLFKWLGRHPQLTPALRKEIDFFSLDFDQGESWYRAHFPLEVRRRAADSRGATWMTFEATPTYLFDPRAPLRAVEMVPEAKLVVLLRDPVERAISHYHHNIRHRLENLPLEEALAAEPSRLAPEWARIGDDPAHRAIRLRRFSYVARSRYAEQLERWYPWFGPEQFVILRSEDLFARPGESLDKIADFLGLDRWHPPELRNDSYVGGPGSDEHQDEPSDQALAMLHEQLDGPTAALTELLGPEFTW